MCEYTDKAVYIQGLGNVKNNPDDIRWTIDGVRGEDENELRSEEFELNWDTLVSPVIKIPHGVTLAAKPQKLLIIDMSYAKHARSLEKVFYPK